MRGASNSVAWLVTPLSLIHSHFPKMQFTTALLALLGTASALEITSPVANNSRIAVPARSRMPKGAADVDLDELLSERITKRKAMTYCADQDSTDGMLLPRLHTNAFTDTIS